MPGQHCVLKVGGSLHAHPQLPMVLKHWHDFSPPLVMVPGGGPFADQVRLVQQHWRFADDIAHAMAVLAMQQYAQVLAAVGQLPLCRSQSLQPPCVWLPDEHILPDDCPRNWSVTSDTMALALAKRTRADHLLLLKSALPQQAHHSGRLLDEMFWHAMHDWQLAGRLKCAIITPDVCQQINSIKDVAAYRVTAA